MHGWTTALTVLVAALAVGCTPEDRPPVLIGGDGGDDAGFDTGTDDAADCVPALYPCAPYGRQRCDTIVDHRFVAANDPARAMAGPDGLLDMHDLYADESITGVLLFGTAGWCGACSEEARALNDLRARYQNIGGTGNRVEFVAVVFQDNVGAPATADYAAQYAARYGFEFPAVADTAGDILYYFDAASSPGNVVVDATDMTLFTVIQGFNEPMLRAVLGELDGSATCRR